MSRITIIDKSPFFESLNQGYVTHRVRGCVRGLCQSLFSNHLNRGYVTHRVRGCVRGLYQNQCVCTSTCRSLLSKPLVEAFYGKVFIVFPLRGHTKN